MKECRLTQDDLLKISTNPVLGELELMSKLIKLGFDLGKEINFYKDDTNNEYVYTQED